MIMKASSGVVGRLLSAGCSPARRASRDCWPLREQEPGEAGEAVIGDLLALAHCPARRAPPGPRPTGSAARCPGRVAAAYTGCPGRPRRCHPPAVRREPLLPAAGRPRSRPAWPGHRERPPAWRRAPRRAAAAGSAPGQPACRAAPGRTRPWRSPDHPSVVRPRGGQPAHPPGAALGQGLGERHGGDGLARQVIPGQRDRRRDAASPGQSHAPAGRAGQGGGGPQRGHCRQSRSSQETSPGGERGLVLHQGTPNCSYLNRFTGNMDVASSVIRDAGNCPSPARRVPPRYCDARPRQRARGQTRNGRGGTADGMRGRLIMLGELQAARLLARGAPGRRPGITRWRRADGLGRHGTKRASGPLLVDIEAADRIVSRHA